MSDDELKVLARCTGHCSVYMAFVSEVVGVFSEGSEGEEVK
jgi:hypothetical protein